MLNPGPLGQVVTNTNPQRIVIRGGNTVVFVGDSITATSQYWVPFQTAADVTFTALGAPLPTWVNSGVGSSGLIAALPLSFNVGLRYQTYVGAYNPHALICELGVNDIAEASWTQAEFEAAYLNFLTNCLAASPRLRADQILIACPWLLNGDPDAGTPAQMTLLAEGLASTRTVARTLGCKHLDWRFNRPRDGGYTTDGLHPSNPKGVTYLSGKLAAAVSVEQQ